jgi:hypothetical protein
MWLQGRFAHAQLALGYLALPVVRTRRALLELTLRLHYSLQEWY